LKGKIHVPDDILEGTPVEIVDAMEGGENEDPL
jgi:hypothetical protein